MKKYKITENNITYDIIEYTNGTKMWYKNGKVHRDNGPAIEYVDGSKIWYKNGKCHRKDGPAKEWVTGSVEYWYNGKFLKYVKTNEELKRYIKLLSIS